MIEKRERKTERVRDRYREGIEREKRKREREEWKKEVEWQKDRVEGERQRERGRKIEKRKIGRKGEIGTFFYYGFFFWKE